VILFSTLSSSSFICVVVRVSYSSRLESIIMDNPSWNEQRIYELL
jgi:hypothetical protein